MIAVMLPRRMTEVQAGKDRPAGPAEATGPGPRRDCRPSRRRRTASDCTGSGSFHSRRYCPAWARPFRRARLRKAAWPALNPSACRPTPSATAPAARGRRRRSAARAGTQRVHDGQVLRGFLRALAAGQERDARHRAGTVALRQRTVASATSARSPSACSSCPRPPCSASAPCPRDPPGAHAAR